MVIFIETETQQPASIIQEDHTALTGEQEPVPYSPPPAEEEEPDEERVKRQGKMNRRKGAFLLVSLFLLFYAFNQVGFTEIMGELEGLQLWAVVSLTILTVLVFLVDAYRWKIVTDGLQKAPYRSLFPIFLSGNFVNNITPGLNNGGEVVRSYYLSRLTGRTNAECLATIVLDGAAMALAFLTLFFFSLFYMLFFLKIPAKFLLIVAAVFGFLASCGLLYYHHRKTSSPEERHRKFSNLLKWVHGLKPLQRVMVKYGDSHAFESFVRGRIEHFKKTLGDLWKKKNLFWKAYLMSFLPMFIMVVRAYILFQALGITVEPLTILAVMAFSYFLGYFIPLPGGLGVTETMMIELYIFNGVDSDIAGAVTLIDRAFFLLVAMGGGYFCLNWLGYKYNVKGSAKTT